ncbi:hypothetical protein C3L33_13796, partial [Rhododendron williamsianum]
MVLLSLPSLVVVAAVLLNLFTAASTTTAASATTTVHADFQHLKVREAIDTMTKIRVAKTGENHDELVFQGKDQRHSSDASGKWKLKLLHRDKIPVGDDYSSHNNNITNWDYHHRYEVQYGDGSYTKGTLALETLTFDQTTVRNVAIGCGHRNRGMFIGAAGLLGLGGGSMSFVGQLGGQTGGAFAYCLVSRGIESTGSLEFGRAALPVGAAWVPLLRNPRAPSFYYIGLAGLGVGGIRVPIPESVFQLTELGDGGVVMDTGTAVTRLPTAAYVAFRDAFITQTASLPRSPGVSIFDTCYDLNGFVSVRVPTVSFYFSGGPILTLPARNFLIPVNESGTFCFAFAPSPSGLSIIGNIQQEGIQISFDGANGFVGFGPNVC